MLRQGDLLIQFTTLLHARSTNLCISSSSGLSLLMASSSGLVRPRYAVAFSHPTNDFDISAKWISLSIFLANNSDGIPASISSKDDLSMLPDLTTRPRSVLLARSKQTLWAWLKFLGSRSIVFPTEPSSAQSPPYLLASPY